MKETISLFILRCFVCNDSLYATIADTRFCPLDCPRNKRKQKWRFYSQEVAYGRNEKLDC